MRKTYRNLDVESYWQKRWSNIESDEEMINEDVYPLKYSQEIIQNKTAKILEAGCGAGRIIRFYHNKGYHVVGIDYIESAINKLKDADKSLQVFREDIKNLSFDDNKFKYVLAFGLYHGIEIGLDKAISETYRVMENEGILCASFRADNIQNRINDLIYDIKQKRDSKNNKKYFEFHKLNLNKKEIKNLFYKAGFKLISIKPVVNMPILYKFKFFRHMNHKIFNESLGRKEGYKLSTFGNIIQNLLFYCFPNQFCNLYVVYLQK